MSLDWLGWNDLTPTMRNAVLFYSALYSVTAYAVLRVGFALFGLTPPWVPAKRAKKKGKGKKKAAKKGRR